MTIVLDVTKIQQIMSFLVLAAVIVAGVQCSNHKTEERTANGAQEDSGGGGSGPAQIKAQSRVSMTKIGGYGARVQIREDLNGRKHAHAMAICDCNGQGPWRPLFKPSQIFKTEFPEHESFHDEVDSQYRSLVGDQDNQLRSSLSSSDHLTAGSDSDGIGGGSSIGGVSGGGVGGFLKKHNHMIHLHLIPHIYVPVVHSAGFPEAKHYHATIEDGSSSLPAQPGSVDLSSEFPNADVTGGGTGSTAAGSSENPPTGDHDHGNFNGHSGETSYYTINEDAAVHQPPHQDLNPNDHFGNAIETSNHDYEVPANSVHEEPHQYQVHELDDLSKDYSSKKHVTAVSSGTSAAARNQQQQQQQQQQKNRNQAATVKQNRYKHGRKLTSRQDLKNLLVMRPPPMGQTQTWRYVYRSVPPPPPAPPLPPHTVTRNQFYRQRKLSPAVPVPVLQTRTVPLILHIRQRSDK